MLPEVKNRAMSQRVTLSAADGHEFDAWRTDPAGTAKGGIVILHAVYGLTTHMGDLCDRYAGAGYAAIAPALYDRIGKDIVHPYGPDGAEAGQHSYGALSQEQILSDVGACAAALRVLGPVTISGFCTGGTWAWVASATLDFDAQVNFYGSHVPARLEFVPKCPTIMHYGDSDRIVPMTDIDRIRATCPEVTIHIYPGGGHAFFNPEQESHHAANAALVWERTVAFLDGRFGAGSRASAG